MNKNFDNDPVMLMLRKKYRKQGPNPEPGEPIDKWAERFLEYVRKKHEIEEKK